MLNRSIHKTLLGLAFLLLGLLPLACVVESEGEVIVLRIALPGSVGDSDFVVVTLTDPGKDSSWLVYEGPAPARNADNATRTLRRQVPGYQGSDAMVLIQVYRTSAGAVDRDPLDLTGETQYRLSVFQGRDTAIGIDTLLRSTPYPEFPKDGSDGEVGQGPFTLAWNAAPMPLPAPAYTLYFGTSNPPPLLGDKIKVTHFQHRTELADTVYYWQLKARRGEVQVTGPVWSFRTAPLAPGRLGYPGADSTFRVGLPDTLRPEVDRSSKNRFRALSALPPGLALDSLTGALAGVPREPTDSVAKIVIEVANGIGSRQSTFDLRVRPRSVDLRYGLPEGPTDSMTYHLLGPAGKTLELLSPREIQGPGPGSVRLAMREYDGLRAFILQRGWRGGALVWERRFGIQGEEPVVSQVPIELPEPILLRPARDTVLPYSTAEVELAWTYAAVLDPPPFFRLFAGLGAADKLVGDSLTTTSFRLEGLVPDTIYHWRLELHRAGITSSSTIGAFRTLPVPAAASPFPAPGAADLDTVVELSWSLPGDASPLRVGLFARLHFGVMNPPPLLQDSLAGSPFHAVGLLQDTVYYWRVDHHLAGVVTPGQVWSFRTRPRAPLPFFYPADTILHAGEAAEVSPTHVGSRASFTVSPELPPGLALDPFTGRIHGTPLTPSLLKEHTVTASNVLGSASTKVRIGVGPRILDLVLSDSLRVGADSVTVELRAASGALLHRFILIPAPKEARFRHEVPSYDGGEATVILRGYASDSSRLPFDSSRLPFVQWEEKRRVNQILGVNESLPFSLPAPVLTSPADGYAGPYAEEGVEFDKVDLEWDLPKDLDPLARVHLLVGTDNPPSSYYWKDLQLRRNRGSVFRIYAETNATHHWQVEINHAGRRVRSVVRTFHTSMSPPHGLEYLQDSVPTAGRPVRIKPKFLKSDHFVPKELRYSISPALPPSFVLDSLTGAITGSFPAPAPRTEYTVTVRNPKGTLDLPLAFRARPAMPAAPRLVANYKQAHTITLVDETAFGHHGVLQGNVKIIPGVSGEGIELDGRSYATIGVTPALELDGFTISLWFRPDDQDSTDPLLEYSEVGGLVGVSIWVNTAGDGRVIPGAVFCNLRPIDASAKQLHDIRERNTLAATGTVAKIGAWNHLALSYDAKSQSARLYVNGRLESDTVFPTSFTPRTRGRIFVGYRPKDTAEWDANHSFKGGLDEIQIWEGALGAAELEAYYRSLAPASR